MPSTWRQAYLQFWKIHILSIFENCLSPILSFFFLWNSVDLCVSWWFFFFFLNHFALQFRRMSSFSAPSISLILSLAVFNFLFIYLLDFKFQHCIFHFHLVFFQRFLFSDFSFFLALWVPFIPSYESFVVFFFLIVWFVIFLYWVPLQWLQRMYCLKARCFGSPP